jgi:hypothetical protein
MVTSWKNIVQYHKEDIDFDIETQNISITTRISPVAFYSQNYLFISCPIPDPSPWSYWSIPHFYNFVILRMLYMWNRTFDKV